MALGKTYFFGWKNIKWGLKELIKMYSNEPSFFSYKRFQTGVAFFMFTQGAMYVLTNHIDDVTEFLEWCIPVLLVCGYTLNQIQKEKKDVTITEG